MIIKNTNIGVEIYADNGRAIKPKNADEPIVESVSLAPSDSPDNWEDCDKPEPEILPLG